MTGIVLLLSLWGCFGDAGEPGLLQGVRQVRFDSNGAETPAFPERIPILDTEIRLGRMPQDPVRSGYHFAGWSYTHTDGSTLSFSTNTPIPATMTVHAVWKKIHTVAFEPNQGDPVLPRQVVDGEPVTNLPVPRRTGSTFVGWCGDTNLSTPWGAADPVTGDMTLYARWTDTAYTLSFDGNGHTGGTVPGPDVRAYRSELPYLPPGSTMQFLSNEISHLFIGWNTSPDGSGTNYPAGGVFPMPATNVTLYAQWQLLGGTGPGGGIVYYDKGSYSQTRPDLPAWRYLEAAPSSTEWSGVAWGRNGIFILYLHNPGICHIMGYGYYNTQMVADNLTASGMSNCAAQLCRDLVSGGKDDWFLPSMDEVVQMVASSAIIPGVTGKLYWSSSEGSRDSAYLSLSWQMTYKDRAYYVRAIRQF